MHVCVLVCVERSQLMSNTGPGQGMRCDEPLYWRSVNSKDAGQPCLSHHHRGWWNEMKWMGWVWRNGQMKFVVGENGTNPERNLPRLHFVHHETYMGATEMQTRDTSSGRWVTNRLCHRLSVWKEWLQTQYLKNRKCTRTSKFKMLASNFPLWNSMTLVLLKSM